MKNEKSGKRRKAGKAASAVIGESEKHDKCGVFGVYSMENHVALTIYEGLVSLQHRGQESCGIASFDGKEIRVQKGMGLVSDFFDDKKLQFLIGKSGVGHVRYSTTGGSVVENAQPFVYKGPSESFAVGLNGNITNYDILRDELEGRGQILTTTTDTEVIALMLSEEFEHAKDIFAAIKSLMSKLEGSYSLAILTDRGKVIGVRDPLGFRPLCIGKRNGDWILSSESAALDTAGANFEREVKPGEAVVIHEGKLSSKQLLSIGKTAHCMFEYVYFARPDSILEGKVVSNVREALGRTLGRLYPLKADLVVPIPDSGRSAAYGYSLETGIRLSEALIKNRYVWRTFIMPSQDKRKSSVRMKLNPIKELVKGKRIALVDDSLVRGTTLVKIARILREAGAKEIHLLVSCPPICSPCYMGINFPTYGELAANKKSVEEIRDFIGVDSLNYMTLEGLVQSIGLRKESLCLACLNGEYPVKIRSPSRI